MLVSPRTYNFEGFSLGTEHLPGALVQPLSFTAKKN
jgi:hypothetical protein